MPAAAAAQAAPAAAQPLHGRHLISASKRGSYVARPDPHLYRACTIETCIPNATTGCVYSEWHNVHLRALTAEAGRRALLMRDLEPCRDSAPRCTCVPLREHVDSREGVLVDTMSYARPPKTIPLSAVS